MAFETKEQVLENILTKEKPNCPHCNEEMSLWEVPPVAMGDGLGWGTPYLYICFNDDCPLYKKGWDNIRENFGQTASYRCMCYPEGGGYECIPVFGPEGARGQIIDEQALAEEEALKEKTKQGFLTLAECYRSNDWQTVLELLLDGRLPGRVRIKAAEMLGDIGDLKAAEAMRNQKFGIELLVKQVEESIGKIHDRHFTRECPFCAEIIKKRAKVCKHCGRDVAGE